MARFFTETNTKQRYLYLLERCSSVAQLLQIQAQIYTTGLLQCDDHLVVELVRLSALSKFGDLLYARQMFDSLRNPTLLSWNHLIRGYCNTSSSEDAVKAFTEMRRRGTAHDELTIPFVFKSCTQLSALELGRQVHADVIKSGLNSDVYVNNTLINLYGSSRKINEAKLVFGSMILRTKVSWNTMLSCFMDNSLPVDVVESFNQMMHSDSGPDETTFVILLSALTELGNLNSARCLHTQILRKDFEVNLHLGTALVDMYAKLGSIQCAEKLFVRMKKRNVRTWSAMISGLSQHGTAAEAFDLLSQMKKSSIEPNDVTYLGVICACSHAGLVDEAFHFYHEMVHVYHIQPTLAHYSAMVTLLGRQGLLVEAYDFITNIPIKADAVIWRTLLSACQLHFSKDTKGVGEKVRRKLLALEPRRVGNLVLVANMYSAEGSWAEVAQVRRTMREEGLKKKVPGESWIDVSGRIHHFVSGHDLCFDLKKKFYPVLEKLRLNMIDLGFEDMIIIETGYL